VTTMLRPGFFGNTATKSTGTLAATTIPLFVVSGGKIALTMLFGEVTTAITVANTYKLQHNPTTGTVGDLVTGTDIGTTDTLVGSLLSWNGDLPSADSIRIGVGKIGGLKSPIIVTAGQIESVSTGTDGVILWSVCWVPLDAGAALVAA
jgi:hypothetical protein